MSSGRQDPRSRWRLSALSQFTELWYRLRDEATQLGIAVNDDSYTFLGAMHAHMTDLDSLDSEESSRRRRALNILLGGNEKSWSGEAFMVVRDQVEVCVDFLLDEVAKDENFRSRSRGSDDPWLPYVRQMVGVLIATFGDAFGEPLDWLVERCEQHVLSGRAARERGDPWPSANGLVADIVLTAFDRSLTGRGYRFPKVFEGKGKARRDAVLREIAKSAQRRRGR